MVTVSGLQVVHLLSLIAPSPMAGPGTQPAVSRLGRPGSAGSGLAVRMMDASTVVRNRSALGPRIEWGGTIRGSSHAEATVEEVTVFVDTAVLGTLVPICVKEGTPTDSYLTVNSEVAGGTGLGVAWMLILLGPLGWLGLIVIAFVRRPSDVLTVELPFSEHAYQRYRSARRMQHTWLFGAIILAVLAFAAYRLLQPLGALGGGLLGLCALAACVAGLLEWRRVRSLTVGVALDASRRWVTLSGVHPDFARAVGGPSAWSEHGGRVPVSW